jgi:hypothetical protein
VTPQVCHYFGSPIASLHNIHDFGFDSWMNGPFMISKKTSRGIAWFLAAAFANLSAHCCRLLECVELSNPWNAFPFI